MPPPRLNPVDTTVGVRGDSAKTYFSSLDPRAREIGARWMRADIWAIGTLWSLSVIGKQPCVSAEAGSSGVFQVKRVMGRLE